MDVEEGVYAEAHNGVKMEAAKFTSTATDSKGSWLGEAQTYANAYSQPIVLGQVMTFNESGWSTFCTHASSAVDPPSSSSVCLGSTWARIPT